MRAYVAMATIQEADHHYFSFFLIALTKAIFESNNSHAASVDLKELSLKKTTTKKTSLFKI